MRAHTEFAEGRELGNDSAEGKSPQERMVLVDRLPTRTTTTVRAQLAPGVREWLISPAGPLGLGLALAMGQATLLGKPGGVAIAYYAALMGAGVPLLPLVGAALVAGVWLGNNSLHAGIAVIAGLAIMHVLAVGLRRLPLRRTFQVGLLAGVGTALALALLPIMAGSALLDLMVPFAGALSLVLAMVMAVGPRALRRGRPFALEEQVALIVIGLAGFGGALTIPGIGQLIAAGIAGFVILQAANHAGYTGGAAAGAVLGLGCFLFNGGEAVAQQMALAFVLSGLIAGLFASLGRWYVALGYVLCNALLLGMVMGVDYGAMQLLAAGLAGVAAGCFVIPNWSFPLPALTREDETVEGGRHYAKQRIASLARIFSTLQKTFGEVAVHAPAEAMGSDLTQSLASVHGAICKGCSLQHMCWEQDVFRTYQKLQRIWDALEAGDQDVLRAAGQDFGRRCVAVDQVTAVLANQHERRQLERTWSLRLAEGRYVMAEYMQQIGQLLSRLASDLEPGDEAAPGKPRLSVSVHIASARKGNISGDGILDTPLPDGRHLVMLSDGMGSGAEAAEQSGHAIRLVHQLLAAGFSSDVAVQTVNAIMLLRDPGETFATADLALIDLVGGRTEMTKVGAPPTLLKRGREIFRITGAAAPVGIVGGIRPETHVRYLRPGDCLIMCTDGLWDRLGQRMEWVEELLRRAQQANLALLAERLLEEAVPTGESAPDDVTVVILGITAASRRVGEWQPVRRAREGRNYAG